MLQFPNLPQLPAIGLALAGLAKSIVMVPSFPDSAVGGISKYPEHRQEVSDIVSTTAFSIFGMNTLISPLMSSTLNKYFGFRVMMDWLLIIMLISGVGYITSTIFDLVQETRLSRYKAKMSMS